MSENRKTPAGWLVALAFVSIASTQAVYDQAAAPYKAEAKVAAIKLAEPALPSLATLKALSMGNQAALADYLWIDTIQYFGAGNPYENYPSLGKLLTTVTDLDPKFQAPYEFALITLPFMKQAETAVALGEKAQKEIPNNGLLTYYLATVYHLNLKDYQRAAELYQKAASEPDAPGAAVTLAGSALNQINATASDRLVAAAFWETVYQKAETEDERVRAKAWYDEMQIIYTIEITAEQYKTAHGVYPASIQAMVDGRLLSSYPPSPAKRKLVLDSLTGKVDFSQLEQ